jgi:hypothetical protein
VDLSSTFVDVAVLLVAGILGGNALGLAMKEYSLGPLKNTIAGAVGGSGSYFLQTFIPPPVDAAGNPVPDTSAVDHLVILALVGLAAGGMLTLVLGFVRSETAKRRSE